MLRNGYKYEINYGATILSSEIDGLRYQLPCSQGHVLFQRTKRKIVSTTHFSPTDLQIAFTPDMQELLHFVVGTEKKTSLNVAFMAFSTFNNCF